MASHSEISANRTAQYMRKSLGFYPTDKEKSNSFTASNERVIEFLKKQNISGRNAREHFAAISVFAEQEANVLLSEKACESLDACFTLAYSTVLTAIGNFESYLSYQRKNSDHGNKRRREQ
jgi:hypothetical protein